MHQNLWMCVHPMVTTESLKPWPDPDRLQVSGEQVHNARRRSGLGLRWKGAANVPAGTETLWAGGSQKSHMDQRDPGPQATPQCGERCPRSHLRRGWEPQTKDKDSRAVTTPVVAAAPVPVVSMGTWHVGESGAERAPRVQRGQLPKDLGRPTPPTHPPQLCKLQPPLSL